MITVVTTTTNETKQYQNKKYDEFMDYYENTEIPVTKIFEKINVNQRNSTARFIREQLRKNGFNSDLRWRKIIKKEWLAIK